MGAVEAKWTEDGEDIIAAEGQPLHYANSTFKWVNRKYAICTMICWRSELDFAKKARRAFVGDGGYA